MSNVQEGEVAIIGAGPVGLFAVFELGMLKITAHVIDALDGPGGQCSALYPEKPIYDIPAHPEIMAADLIGKLTEQATPFAPVYHYGQQVVGLEQQTDGRWLLETSKGTRLLVKAVMIAGGVGAFGPNRPPLAGIECYENAGPGLGVRYMVTQRENYRGKRIVIAGGGDSAVDWALSLAELAEKVYVVHRRPKFRAAPESVARLNQLAEQGSVVEMVIPYQLRGLQGDGSLLEAVIVADLAGNERRLDADVLLPFFGLSMNLGPIADWGLALEHGHITVTPETCQTNLQGVYAIGDIADYPGKLKLILCGFSEAAMAAHAIRSQLHPDEELHWEYSTTKGVPGE
ncbi:NAD(P)/FAD-dependent oxidoreductase [Limibacillus halophilus]|uniref:Ferredoxin--NADP reductase n=1 Tax=Limibacillus halophilus TaxID=1579333 RepID=A0A839SP93_9PROT|nr:NAD(P)/FAD-dependent oxidoreductase [Limibacillus halophilus]MBB3064018.1 thioredoxin reductase (NADPH) [Limibacillus halophilus]